MRPPESIPNVISRLFAARDTISSSEVAAAAGVSRQAAHHHLKKMVGQGLLAAEGSRRSSRYRMNARRSQSYELANLTESDVWWHERSALLEIEETVFDNAPLLQIIQFSFTEMVNNAIDHSQGTRVDIRWFLDRAVIAFEVDDDGIGAFASIRTSRDLDDDFQAIGELSKGKQTTDPTRHSGLGIFFTSKMVDQFTISANQYLWTVNHDLDDFAIGWLDRPRTGTLVRCEIRRDTTLSPADVYASLADSVSTRFNKTTLHVSLFQEGEFVSRTEAKLMGARLEGFEIVELDFTGIDLIGQGFADELFRVWKADHPAIRLVPLNMNPAVAGMITSIDPPRAH